MVMEEKQRKTHSGTHFPVLIILRGRMSQEFMQSGTGTVEGIQTFPMVFLVTFQVSVFFSQRGELNPSFLLPE